MASDDSELVFSVYSSIKTFTTHQNVSKYLFNAAKHPNNGNDSSPPSQMSIIANGTKPTNLTAAVT